MKSTIQNHNQHIMHSLFRTVHFLFFFSKIKVIAEFNQHRKSVICGHFADIPCIYHGIKYI